MRVTAHSNPGDRSNGYEAVAGAFMAGRSASIGCGTVREWARDFSSGATLLDLGCGHGRPVTQILVDEGFTVYAVDASASLIAAIREQLPVVQVECAAVEDSDFFGRTFDGVIASGLMFLLTPDVQLLLIRKVSQVLVPGGRFLFTAPSQACEWPDALTGRKSVALGLEAYRGVLAAAGLTLVGERRDEGDNHYYLTVKTPEPAVRTTLPLGSRGSS